MKYLLDTNTCVDLIRNTSQRLIKKIVEKKVTDIAISTITLSELEYGAYKSSNVPKAKMALAEFIAPITILPYDDTIAPVYGKIRADLQKKGTPIGALDLLIGAHALSGHMILVTSNVKEFKRIEGLSIENWMMD